MSDDRFATLLRFFSELDGLEEKRSLVEAVCEGDSALQAELMETLTMPPNQPAPPPEADAIEPGQLVADRFRIVRQLGQGGMAVVYEGMDEKLSERRALKFPKTGHAPSLSPEARSAMRVTHNNICRIHEIHTTATDAGPADFISMEYLEGETLQSRVRREAIPAPEALEIARQLCAGLDAAHRANILHRDLKSNNVMLTQNADGSLRAVITDFGLAGGPRPASGGISGTPNYIAPEVWKGEAATPAADVYALGVILYEVLTGRLPFPRRTPWLKRLNALPEPPGNPRWDAIVLQCLDPDPAKRFATASEVLDAIERAFRISHRKQWIAAAAGLVVVFSSAMIWRHQIFPSAPVGRLAILPFTSTVTERTVDQAVKGGLYDLAGRLAALKDATRRLVVIPLDDVLRNDVNSRARAATRLGATHVLAGTVATHNQVITLQASVVDAGTGEHVRDFTGEFQPGDLAALSTSLAGVVTSAFHLSKAPPQRVRAAAYPLYAAGLASLHAAPAQTDQAIASLENAELLDDGSPEICGRLADAFLQKYAKTKDAHWLAAASDSARRAQSLNPDSPRVLLALGSIEGYEGRPEHAIEILQRAAELEPDNWDVHLRAGLALQQMARDIDAVAAMRKAIRLAPEYYAPHAALAFVLFQTGRYAEAADEFRTETRLAPELTEGYSYLGAALLAMEKEPEAEQALRRSLQLQETRAALNNLGVLLRYQGRDGEAVQVLERALRAGADEAGLRLNLGNALRRTGHSKEALENFQRASDLSRASLLRDPRDAAAEARLAYSMVQLGKPKLTADEALQAARLSPSNYSVLFWSLMTLESLHRREDAFALLADAKYERLKDLRRQPDLASFARDPRFLVLFQEAQNSHAAEESKNDAGTRAH